LQVGLYREVRALNVREVVYSPGLGYVPVVVTSVRTLSEGAAEAVERYAGVVLGEVYTYAADLDYVDALRRSGFSVEQDTHSEPSVLADVYGGAGGYTVKKGGKTISHYPPWGYYSDLLKRVYVYEPLAESMPLVIHEAAHYAVDALGLRELGAVEERVAQLCELLAARGAPPVPPKALAEALRSEAVVQQLVELSKTFGILLEPSPLPRNLAAFDTAVGLAMEGSVGAEVVSGVLRGELCIEEHGLAFTFGKCRH